MRSDQIARGRYKMGGTTTVVNGQIRWWERKIFKQNVDDLVFTLPKKYEGRPDLLAHDVYGTYMLSWLVLQFNNIIDVQNEFVSGVKLRLPTSARVSAEYGS